MRILILAGDGVGPEVIAESRRVLDWFVANRGFEAEIIELDFGLTALAKIGHLMSEETLATALEVDAVLFGSMGGPEYDDISTEEHQAYSILRLRTEMKVFANLRPAIGFAELADAVPYKREVMEGADILLVREANSGLYTGTPRGIEKLPDGGERGVNTLAYTSHEVARVARTAFRLAAERSGRLTSVDKANVLESAMVWRKAVTAVGRDEFPEIELNHLFVDNCAMQLVRDPRQFDVMVTSNMFGDILSDESASLMGSLGMAASGSINDPALDGRKRGLYEPVHGSAPDIAGQGIANPIGAIWSLALAFRHSFDRPDDADLIMAAIRDAIGAGVRTADIAGSHTPVKTGEMTQAILAALDRLK